MITALFSVLGSALSIWDHHEKTKYFDQFIQLKERYYLEICKPDDSRSNAVLDDIEFKLCLLSSRWASAASAASTPDPGAAA